MSTQPSLGAWIRKLRNEAGLSRRELAERVHCAEVTVRKIETGERIPSRALALSLAAHLRVSDLDRPAFLALASRRGRRVAPPPLEDPPSLRLFGRDPELEALTRAVLAGEARPLTITGPGGVGKTTLARAGMARVADRVTAAWFVDFSALVEAELFLATLAEALALPDDVDVPTRIAERVGGPTLLVLDNLEHLSGVASYVQQLLDKAPALAVVATSRARLALDAERVLDLQPLSTTTVTAGAVPPAVALFEHRARLADPAFELKADSLASVRELCHRLDGLPLAIELVAARVRLMSPQHLLDRLIVDGRLQLGLVVDGLRALPERQNNLNNLMAWSYRLLPGTVQAVFRRLSVFSGDFPLEAAEAVCVLNDGVTLGSVWNALTILVDCHLLEARIDSKESRFRLLETVREFASRQLEEAGELDAAHRAHLAYFRRWLADGVSRQQTDQAAWLRILQGERANLYAALDAAIAAGERQIAAELAIGLFSLWIVRGHFNEALHRVERVLAMPGAEPWPPPLELRLTNNAAICAQRLYDFDRAFQLFDRCLSLARLLDDRSWLANLENNLGRLLLDGGRPAEAGAHLERARAGYQAVAEPMLGYALVGCGEVRHYAGDYEAAEALFAEAAERLTAIGQSDYAAWAQLHKIWAQIDARSSSYDDIDAVVETFKILGDQIGAAAGALTRARLAWARNEMDEARRLAGDVRRTCIGPAFRWVEREAILLEADLALQQGHVGEASRVLDEADPILSTSAFGCLATAIELRRVAVTLFDDPSDVPHAHLAAVRQRLADLGDLSTVHRFFAWFDDVWWAGGGG